MASNCGAVVRHPLGEAAGAARLTAPVHLYSAGVFLWALSSRSASNSGPWWWAGERYLRGGTSPPFSLCYIAQVEMTL